MYIFVLAERITGLAPCSRGCYKGSFLEKCGKLGGGGGFAGVKLTG